MFFWFEIANIMYIKIPSKNAAKILIKVLYLQHKIHAPHSPTSHTGLIPIFANVVYCDVNIIDDYIDEYESERDCKFYE